MDWARPGAAQTPSTGRLTFLSLFPPPWKTKMAVMSPSEVLPERREMTRKKRDDTGKYPSWVWHESRDGGGESRDSTCKGIERALSRAKERPTRQNHRMGGQAKQVSPAAKAV